MSTNPRRPFRTFLPILLPLTCAALTLTPGAARADTVGNVCKVTAAPGTVVAERTDERGACAGFTVRDAKGRVTSAAAGVKLGSGTLVSSADGRTVIFVHDYPLAHLDASGAVRTLDGEPLDAVIVLRDGKVVARHALDVLLVRPHGVMASVSHVMWTESFDMVVGATWRLKTKTGRRLTFDGVSGMLTAAEDIK